jgi:MoaA/NifB/PqqE/SkfB family radical SAM enzyme
MPHLGLAIQNEGDMCVCNVNSQSYELDGEKKTIDKITVDQIWASPTRKKIADLLDNGIRNPGCQACWQQEDAGVTSSRQELNEAFSNLEPSDTQPKILIIKPGNICNAACRMCRPETSTSWYKDGWELHKQKNPTVKFNEYIKNFESVKNSFNPDSDNMWPVLNKWYKEMSFIDIYGGEPWMIPGLWNSLMTAIDQDYAKDLSLRLHTNGTWWNEEYMSVLKKFKEVTVGVSIDSHNASEFEYIRHKLNYATVAENLHKFLNFSKDNSNLKVHITVTITPFNIWNLDEIYYNLKKQFGRDHQINIGITNFVYSPSHYDIRHLPREVKQLIADKLNQDPVFKPVLEFMNQVIPGCVYHWPRFCLETEKLDKIRNVNFQTVYPDWANILQPYWNYKKPHPEWYGSCTI